MAVFNQGHFALQGRFGNVETFLIVINSGEWLCAIDIYWEKARDAAKLPSMPRTPPTVELSALSVSSVEIEKPCFKEYIWIESLINSNLITTCCHFLGTYYRQALFYMFILMSSFDTHNMWGKNYVLISTCRWSKSGKIKDL